MKLYIFVVIVLCAQCEAADSVYKIILTQKGYAQYLQYNVETPAIREFTLCAWLRFYDLEADQTLFSYVVNGGRHVLKLYMTSGGANIQILLGKAFSTIAVSLKQDAWNHVCLSYQSDHGAWALYLNSRLVSCEASKSLRGFIFPGHGKLLIGYGADDSDVPIGMEGEVFGVNMILISTIERSFSKSIKNEQNLSKSKKILDKDNSLKYIILDTLNYVDKSTEPVRLITKGSMNRDSLKKSNSFNLLDSDSEEKEILDMPINFKVPLPLSETVWSIVNSNGHSRKFKKYKNSSEISGSGTQDLPMISTFETPPPLVPPAIDNFKASMEVEQDYKKSSSLPNVMERNVPNSYSHELLDIETPPPVGKSQPVFGQWSSSNFPGRIFNYLKSINFMTPPKRVPSTIPLPKLSDSLPYYSNLKVIRVHAPLKFQRKSFLDRHNKIMKRHVPQINVKIIEENTRDDIIRYHARTRPINVEVTFRGENIENTENKLYRDIEGISPEEYNSIEDQINNKESEKANTNTFNFIIPFKDTKMTNEMYGDIAKAKINSINYTKISNTGSNWNNDQHFNSNSRARHRNTNTADSINNLLETLRDENPRSTGFIKNHKPDYYTEEYLKGKKDEVYSKVLTSNHQFDSKLMLAQNNLFKTTPNMMRRLVDLKSGIEGQHNFDKPIKIGNALNERLVIGINEEAKKLSFEGGDDKVPDINRFRSDIDNESGQQVPPSLVPKVCKSVELFGGMLYVHADGSVDGARFASPSRVKNIAVIFILNHFNNCSLHGTQLENSYLLFIDWTKTPINLMGGAYPKKNKSVCGSE